MPYNRDMTHLDILLPFGLPPAEMAPDLMRGLIAPALATLMARTKSFTQESSDSFSHALPHESWLARQFGLTENPPRDTSPPIAIAMMKALGLKPLAGVWFMLNPVHIHIARDHLVLTDRRQLQLSEVESRALFETAQPLFEEAGKTLMYGDVHNWFMRAVDWHGLQTSTPDAACGHNIDIWMPKGSAARDWRKLQNEVQMHWHTHPINAARENRGAKPVNSLWLWACASMTMEVAPCYYQEVFNLSDWMRGLRQFPLRQMQECSPSDVIAAAPERGLLILDKLIEPALSGDWSSWLERFHSIDDEWLTPLLAALQSKKLDQLSLILTHNAARAEFIVSKNSLRKFWARSAFTRLIP